MWRLWQFHLDDGSVATGNDGSRTFGDNEFLGSLQSWKNWNWLIESPTLRVFVEPQVVSYTGRDRPRITIMVRE